MIAVLAIVAVVMIGLSFLLSFLMRGERAAERVRRQAVAALCAQRDLVPGVVPGDFALIGHIGPRSLTNSFSSADHAVAVSDLIQPAGKSWVHFSVLGFAVAGLNIPYVSVTRRNLGMMLVGGPPKLELESIDFDQRFTVRAKDSRSAVMLLDPGMMQLLLDCGQVNFDMLGGRVLAYVSRDYEPAHKPTEPVEFEELFRFFDGFVARVPALIHTEYPATT